MARPYSNNLRDRVAAAVVSGRSSGEVARTVDVSVSSAVKRSQRLRAMGTAAASKWAVIARCCSSRIGD